jgi:hypothetical protein
MSERMFKGLCIMGGLNFLLYLCSLSVVTNSSYTGPEGIGSAFLGIVSLLFSVLLTGFGLRQLYTESFQKPLAGRTLIATLVAASPLLVCLCSMALRLRVKN